MGIIIIAIIYIVGIVIIIPIIVIVVLIAVVAVSATNEEPVQETFILVDLQAHGICHYSKTPSLSDSFPGPGTQSLDARLTQYRRGLHDYQ